MIWTKRKWSAGASREAGKTQREAGTSKTSVGTAGCRLAGRQTVGQKSTQIFICRAETIVTIRDKYSTREGEISRRGKTNELEVILPATGHVAS